MLLNDHHPEDEDDLFGAADHTEDHPVDHFAEADPFGAEDDEANQHDNEPAASTQPRPSRRPARRRFTPIKTKPAVREEVKKEPPILSVRLKPDFRQRLNEETNEVFAELGSMIPVSEFARTCIRFSLAYLDECREEGNEEALRDFYDYVELHHRN